MDNVKKQYRVYKLRERRVDGECHSVLNVRQIGTYGRKRQTYDDFDTEEEAVKFGAEKYGYSRFTVLPVYHEIDEWEREEG
jgi:hypothetical protein